MKQKVMFARVGVNGSVPSGPPGSASTEIGQDEGSHAAAVLLTEPEVADRLRVSLACLRRWRLERRGPRFLKLGTLVRYPADDLNAWIASLPTGGSAAVPVPALRQARGIANA